MSETAAAPIQSSPNAPTCGLCGFTVAKKGELCDACKDKQDAAPKGRWELGPQPVPVHMRDGRAAKGEDDDEDADAD